jgi:hypothetical protein
VADRGRVKKLQKPRPEPMRLAVRMAKGTCVWFSIEPGLYGALIRPGSRSPPADFSWMDAFSTTATGLRPQAGQCLVGDGYTARRSIAGCRVERAAI